jgi:hypothetical protein
LLALLGAHHFLHVSRIRVESLTLRLLMSYRGWGKITSLNFKVNNKNNIRDTKILFLDSETTKWEV